MLKRFLYMSILLPLLACSTVNSLFSNSPGGEPDPEEQAVYAVLFSDYHRDRIVLKETTDSGLGFMNQDSLPQELPGLSPGLWSDYLARNDRAYPLSAEMEIGVNYVFLDDREMGDIFDDSVNGWEEFYRRYPDLPGITTLSRVGFNRERTEALVYMGAQFHYLAGAGNLYRLEKQDGVWKIVEKVMLWIS